MMEGFVDVMTRWRGDKQECDFGYKSSVAKLGDRSLSCLDNNDKVRIGAALANVVMTESRGRI